MTNDLQQARISVEVLDEYRRIAAWLEAQAATRGPVGDTMHGLAAEALTNLIEHEYSRHTADAHLPTVELIAEAREQAAYLRGVSRDGSMPYSGELLESLADALESVRAERDDALTRIAEAAELHYRDTPSVGGDWCLEDHHEWPCPTAVALGLNEGERK